MKYISLLVFALSLAWITPLHTSMTGGNFEIYADSIGFVDSSGSTGGDFTLYGSGHAYAAVSTTGGVVELRGGFQAQEIGILSLSLSTTTIDLGTLSESSVASSSLSVTISTDSETGYSIAVSEDGNLRDGANTIDDVADGTVTAGAEEYGITTSGTDGLLSSDTAITGSLNIASTNGVVSERSTTVDFRASIDGSTADGSYSHVVTFTATVNP